MAALAETKNQKITLWLAAVFVLLMILRLLPLLRSPLSTYGYDYGFYLYAINDVSGTGLKNLFAGLTGGYNSPVFLITRFFRIPGVVALTELYFFFAVFLGWAIYSFYKKDEQRAGLFAVVLYACSLAQQEAYLMFLWKNLAALPLLILAFKFLKDRRWQALIMTSLLILAIHRTTTVIYFLTLGLYIIWHLIKSKRYRILLSLTALAFLVFGSWFFLFDLKSVIFNLIHNNNFYVTTGLFLEYQNLLKIFWPFALLALPGVFLYIKNRKNSILPIFTGICLLWFAFRLPFYRRILIYFDISLILFGGYFLGSIDYRSMWRRLGLAAIVIFLIYNASDFIMTKTPLIMPGEVQEIKNFQPAGFVLALSANDAPWLLGYLPNQRLAAPGLFEDNKTYGDWMDFWNGQNQKAFLNAFPQPLYLYQRDWHLYGPISACLKPLSENFSEYKCP